MSNDRLLEEFPGAGGEAGEPDEDPDFAADEQEADWLTEMMQRLSRAGLGETAFRAGTHLLSIALVLLAVWGLRAFYLHFKVDAAQPREAAFAAALPTPTPTEIPPGLPPFPVGGGIFASGVPRLALLHTTIPSRPRTEVTVYVVQKDDTLFGIAEKFGLKPETLLWGNTYTLGDDPHRLRVGQELFILPVDGTYHRWSAGEGLNGVARGYEVTPEDIINWPGNKLNLGTLGDWSNPNIEPGTMLIVPGGRRDFVTWSAPRITRANPGVAKIFGPGSCGTIMDGAVGIGAFVWPANNHFLSGYDYAPALNHFGIDIAGRLGDPVYASDNGVIVYAGWNDWGYGNVVVIDHGNGWQTLYAHLSLVSVGCGQSVYQGGAIGSFGSTGNSSGPHLHFEMRHDSYGKVNPWNFLP